MSSIHRELKKLQKNKKKLFKWTCIPKIEALSYNFLTWYLSFGWYNKGDVTGVDKCYRYKHLAQIFTSFLVLIEGMNNYLREVPLSQCSFHRKNNKDF